MQTVGALVFVGSILWLTVEMLLAGAQIALHQARKHGAGDWDAKGSWHWRTSPTTGDRNA